MDGVVDNGACLSDDGLYTDYRDGWLYVAATLPQEPNDLFIYVARDPQFLRSANWSKSAAIGICEYFLSSEGSNDFSGWMDLNDVYLPDIPQFRSANLIEGAVRFDPLDGNIAVAAAVFETQDGGQMISQVPAGDGDLALEVHEYLYIQDGCGVPIPSPDNDDFESARVIRGISGIDTGHNAGATAEPGEPVHAGVTGGASVWWTWEAPETGNYWFNLCQSTPDTTIGIYTGDSVENLQLVTSDDDFCSPGAIAFFEASAGTTYHVAVDGKGGDVGGIRLLWQEYSEQTLDEYRRPFQQYGIGEGPHRVVISPDGTKLLTAGDVGAFLWDIASGQLIRTFRGHEGIILDLSFAPSGRQILTTSRDGTAILWDVDTARRIRPFVHDGSVLCVDFSPASPTSGSPPHGRETPSRPATSPGGISSRTSSATSSTPSARVSPMIPELPIRASSGADMHSPATRPPDSPSSLPEAQKRMEPICGSRPR